MIRNFIYNDQSLRDRRKELRRNQTKAEEVVWQHLRGKKLLGFKFHRQFSVGIYILDFYCPAARLGVELDGDSHLTNFVYDQERSRYLEGEDIKLIRFKNEEALQGIKGVVEKIAQQLASS